MGKSKYEMSLQKIVNYNKKLKLIPSPLQKQYAPESLLKQLRNQKQKQQIVEEASSEKSSEEEYKEEEDFSSDY